MPITRHLAQRLQLLILALAVTSHSALASASAVDWVSGKTVTGSGINKTQTRELEHFTAVSVELPATVELRQGNTESVTIETDDNVLPLIETVVEDRTLKIRPVKSVTRFETRTLKLVVDLRRIDSLASGGSASIFAKKLHAPTLHVSIGGSGSVDIKSLDSVNLSVSVGGSGAFKAAGTADEVSAAIGGSGGLQAGRLNARAVSISVGGSGRSVVWARESLSASLAGSGDVRYYGDPKVSKSVAGSGSVTRLGGAPQ